MKTKISKILITLLVVTLGTVYANSQTEVKDYASMSTSALQIEVEKLSSQGNLPAEMGFELMRRWTETKKEVN